MMTATKKKEGQQREATGNRGKQRETEENEGEEKKNTSTNTQKTQKNTQKNTQKQAEVVPNSANFLTPLRNDPVLDRNASLLCLYP